MIAHGVVGSRRSWVPVSDDPTQHVIPFMHHSWGQRVRQKCLARG